MTFFNSFLCTNVVHNVLVYTIFIKLLHGISFQITTSVSLIPSHNQYSRVDNLLFYNDYLLLMLNDSESQIPNYVTLYPSLFKIQLLSSAKSQLMKNPSTFPQHLHRHRNEFEDEGIAIIFLNDTLMCHMFHFVEHLLGAFTALNELIFSSSSINGNMRVRYAIFPNTMNNDIMCVGKRSINQQLLQLLWPNIMIICGNELKSMMAAKNDSYFVIAHSIISMRISNFEQLNIKCIESESCIWNKMNGAYLAMIQRHTHSFVHQMLTNLQLLQPMYVKKMEYANTFTIAFISRESSANRKLCNSVRDLFIKILQTNDYFGDKTQFTFIVLKLEDYNFYDQIRIISKCDILIGVHGNGLTHILWMGAQSSHSMKMKLVVELLPVPDLRINDYLLQSEFIQAVHFQWDIHRAEIKIGSLNFPHFCSSTFFQPKKNPDGIICEQEFTIENMNKLLHEMKSIWQTMIDDHHFELRMRDTQTCIEEKVIQNEPISVKESQAEYSNGVC